MFKKLFSRSNLILLAILIVASFMRLYKIADYLTFLGDEGRDVLVVYNILHGHPTLLGPTASVGGFFLGPIYYYFMTPFLWLFHYNPVGPAIMVALFGIVTVWLVYYVAAKFFNPTAGLVAALLYAISPVVIIYSRSSWNPNLMPFFSLASLYCLYKGIKEKSWKFLSISGICLGIAMQLHYLTTFLGVIVAVYLLLTTVYDVVSSKKEKLKTIFLAVISYLLYIISFCVGWSLFLLFEIRHDFANIRSIIAFIFHSKETGASDQFQTIVSNVFFRIFGRLVTAFPPPEDVNIHDHLNLAMWYFGTYILAFLCIIFLVVLMVKAWKNRELFFQRILLALWLGIGIFLFGFYKKQIYDYYFTFLFPLPFLLVGAFFSWMFHKKWLAIIAGLGLVVLVVLNLSMSPLLMPANRQMDQVSQIARKVYDEAGGKPFNFALITGGNSDHAYRYFLTIWGNPPVTILNPQVDPQRKSVTNQLLVVCEEVPCHPLGDSLWEVAGFGRAEIVGHWHVTVLDVYKLEHYKGK